MISKKVLYKCAVSELLWTYLNLVLTTSTFSNVLLDSVSYITTDLIRTQGLT